MPELQIRLNIQELFRCSQGVAKMARPIVLSNGELHVGLNEYGLVHDFYYPYVGLTNHSAGSGTRHKIGIWIEGQISWLDDGSWTFSFRYPQRALIGHTLAKNEKLQIILEIDDCVDAHMSVFMRNIHVVNLASEQRQIRIFMRQAFAIDDSRSNTDTAQYLPDSNVILHYRGKRAFIIGGAGPNNSSFDQHSIGLFGIEGHEGTYRDADDGELAGGNVEHGRVDSTIRFKLTVKPTSSERVHYWITAGSSIREALYIDKQMKQNGLTKRLHSTALWWRDWLKPAVDSAAKLEPTYQDSFLRSVMIIKSQLDKRGAVIASTDSYMLNYYRDAYAYCWPRDGALVMWPLIRIGFYEEPYRFFEFCRRVMHPSGYLMHKYRADGGLGASWHPYIHNGGIVAPPIQEDETALVVFVLAQFYTKQKDQRILRDFYSSMIKPMANWMADYVDDTTGLPRPSYDLWEEKFLTSTFTVSTVFAALKAAAYLAEESKDVQSAVRWRSVAEDIKQSSHKYLYNSQRACFYKGLLVNDSQLEYDETIDASSIYGCFMFELFDIKSEEMRRSVDTFYSIFPTSEHGIVAFPRYEYDMYHRVDPNSKGNWWFISTLWMAQYSMATDDPDLAVSILTWINGISMQTSIMAEQISPVDHALISPSPLTWSHAEYLSTLLDTIESK